MRKLLLVSVVTVVAAGSLADIPTKAPLFGDTLTRTNGHPIETLITPQRVPLYIYTDDLAPANVEKATGTVKLRLPDGRMLDVVLKRRDPAAGEPTSYFCPMHPSVVRGEPGKCELCGGMVLYVQDHLFGAADLKGVDPAKVSAMIRVTGLGGAEKEATFAPAFSTSDKKAGTTNSGSK